MSLTWTTNAARLFANADGATRLLTLWSYPLYSLNGQLFQLLCTLQYLLWPGAKQWRNAFLICFVCSFFFLQQGIVIVWFGTSTTQEISNGSVARGVLWLHGAEAGNLFLYVEAPIFCPSGWGTVMLWQRRQQGRVRIIAESVCVYEWVIKRDGERVQFLFFHNCKICFWMWIWNRKRE